MQNLSTKSSHYSSTFKIWHSTWADSTCEGSNLQTKSNPLNKSQVSTKKHASSTKHKQPYKRILKPKYKKSSTKGLS